MKTFFIWMIAGLCVCMNLTAQGGGRRGGGAGGGNRDFGGGSGGAGPQSQTMGRDYDQVQIADFPEIAGLDVTKKLKLFSIVKDEHKNILKLTDQKQGLQEVNNRSDNQKDIDKNLKEISKLDDKLKKESQNADKKIRSALSNDQYKEFIEKKDQIKFNDPPPPAPRRRDSGPTNR